MSAEVKSPYRLAGEKELPPPEPKEPSKVWGTIKTIAVPISCALAGAIGFTGCIINDMDRLEGLERLKNVNSAVSEIRSSVTDAITRFNRKNTCGFIDVERGFRIDSYDGQGYPRIEGFFVTRKEADEFKENLPRCKGN